MSTQTWGSATLAEARTSWFTLTHERPLRARERLVEVGSAGHVKDSSESHHELAPGSWMPVCSSPRSTRHGGRHLMLDENAEW